MKVLWFPGTNPTHRWTAEHDQDNTECFWCMCRPYSPEAKADCVYAPVDRDSREYKLRVEAEMGEVE